VAVSPQGLSCDSVGEADPLLRPTRDASSDLHSSKSLDSSQKIQVHPCLAAILSFFFFDFSLGVSWLHFGHGITCGPGDP
jgi:hypothetical protein